MSRFRSHMLCCLIVVLLSFTPMMGEKRLISKEEAIAFALKQGLKVGLEEYSASLDRERSIWTVTSLVCDDELETISDAKVLDARTGKLSTQYFNTGAFCYQIPIGGGIREKTSLDCSQDLDSLPLAKGLTEQRLTGAAMDVTTPVFSDDDSKIAFQNGYGTIAVINADGTGFRSVADSSSSPQWLDDNWLMYVRNEHIYKQNTATGEIVRVTNQPYGYQSFLISPDKKWLLYPSREMWPRLDKEGNEIMYGITDANEGQNLCLMSLDCKVKKFFRKEWSCYCSPVWSAHSDSILFNIGVDKYCTASLDSEEIQYTRFEEYAGVCLEDFKKVVKGTFPYIHQGRILEIDLKTRKPVRALLEKNGRYKDVFFSHDKRYLIYTKTDRKGGSYQLWIKQLAE